MAYCLFYNNFCYYLVVPLIFVKEMSNSHAWLEKLLHVNIYHTMKTHCLKHTVH